MMGETASMNEQGNPKRTGGLPVVFAITETDARSEKRHHLVQILIPTPAPPAFESA